MATRLSHPTYPFLEKHTTLLWALSLQWRGRSPVAGTHTVGDAIAELAAIAKLTPSRFSLHRRAQQLQEQIIQGDVDDDIQAGIATTR